MALKREFTVDDAYTYNQRSALRWSVSHVWRYKGFVLFSVACFITSWIVFSQARVVIGQAIEEIVKPTRPNGLLILALTVLALLVADGIAILLANLSAENIASRFEADARQELYASLLGKSQTFHDRQRVGDLMARATDDTSQLASMIVPGTTLTFEAVLGTIIPLLFIAGVNWQLTLVPLLFVAGYLVAVRRYIRRLTPVMREQRSQFGNLNAGLEETISGIEVVKASSREDFERRKYQRNARHFRDLFVRQGLIESRYIPLLMYGIAAGAMFGHAMWLYRAGSVSIADIVAVMGLMNLLKFPTFISIFAFSLAQSGYAGAERILHIIKDETDLDENASGHTAAIQGAITFDQVDFSYGEQPVLSNVSFAIEPGQTIAIVGQTGSGKSALTQLVNRTYDVNAGRVLIDGVDVRDWNLHALRSQISKIEQDIFLFSRSVADNIAFGAPEATRAQVIEAAHAAQAHDFIESFANGYDTVIGERGVTLSGGQRQRLALARAFLSDPRILILDDSTSAIDSATEDQIQRAIQQARRGRTTLLITHRLSQIRWADLIVVIDHGRIVAAGTHDDLLRRSSLYRRIFARYDANLPPLETEEVMSYE